ncbi:MAG: carboxypeptidase-like regulatory domain-containing protein [Bacteroidota bacterium]
MKTKSLKFKLLTIFIISITFVYGQAPGTLKGKILDEKGDPMVNAYVYIKTGADKIGDATDFDGNYTIKTIKPGSYNINVSCLGYNDILIPNIYVKPDKITYLESTRMSLKYLTTKNEAEVVGTRTKLIDPEEPNKMSVMGPELEKMPDSRNIPNILKTFDASIQVSESGNDIIIRGSRPGSSSFFIDGVKVDGLAGIPGTGIASMTVYTGGIPPKYGDVTGGIVVIESKSYFDFLNEHKARIEIQKESEIQKFSNIIAE